MKKLYIIGLLALGFSACKPNLEPKKPSSGDMDFSSYLAVGNSLTAGYADGSLYKSGQQNSYPCMIAHQFSQLNGGVFKQPLLPGEFGFPTPKYVLAMKKGPCDAEASLSVIPFPGALDSAGTSDNIAYLGPYNNVGIPGIRCIDYMVPGYGMFNPYAKRFFVHPEFNRPIDEAMKCLPTFFTLWLGANDVLAYATAGGENLSPLAQISNDGAFDISYDSVITIMTRYGAKGVAINIPDITAIPFFTAIPAKGLMLTTPQANSLNDAYNGTGMRFNAGASYFVIEDTTAPGHIRQIQDGEYVLLSVPQDSIKCAGWGSTKPIPASMVLTADEVTKIKTATLQFNTHIAKHAGEHNIPVVDMYSYTKTLQSGIVFGGANYNASFISGAAFSLDGVHLTPRGYALVANQIIMTINQNYNTTVPMVDVNSYPGLKIP